MICGPFYHPLNAAIRKDNNRRLQQKRYLYRRKEDRKRGKNTIARRRGYSASWSMDDQYDIIQSQTYIFAVCLLDSN